MNQWSSMQQQGQTQLPEKDLLHTLLNDSKRTAREYTTAATEANCQHVRQLFTNLLQSTLNAQANLYHHMQQHNLYTPSSPVLRQEIEKQIQQYSQSEQDTHQFLQQQPTPAHLNQQPYYQSQPSSYM
ncbi:spore coat protein [Paenibacillus sp. N3.4]|uniref:spore coat protein n=1 Tax=Paenibacillus sp. N3.4 TaxID=2603222 RepID=UPI0011C9B4EF|nr:spore coat protein [Paenibacillus sp. N3.4]TXK83508.1 spore coat protein [Paenibacillus sp. N3.4]